MLPYFHKEIQGPDQSGLPHHALAVRQVGHIRSPRGILLRHIRTRYVGIMWCLQGGYQDETEGEGPSTGGPGEFGVVFPGKTIVAMRATKNGTELRYLEFDGEDAVRECLAAGLWEGAFRDPAPPFDLLDLIAQNLRAGKPHHLSAASGFVRELLSICGDHARRAAPDKLMHEAQRLIHMHYGEAGFGMQVLQERLGISRTSLNVRFKTAVGTSPHAYLLQQRVRTACHLLAGTTQAVAAISQACGFSDPVRLSQVIRQRTGLSPRAFRQHAGFSSASFQNQSGT